MQNTSDRTPKYSPVELNNLLKLARAYDQTATADQIADALESSLYFDADCEDVMTLQTHLLNGLFNRMLDKAIGGTNAKGVEMPRWISDTSLDTALSIQRHCRATAETLSRIRRRKDHRTTAEEKDKK